MWRAAFIHGLLLWIPLVPAAAMALYARRPGLYRELAPRAGTCLTGMNGMPFFLLRAEMTRRATFSKQAMAGFLRMVLTILAFLHCLEAQEVTKRGMALTIMEILFLEGGGISQSSGPPLKKMNMVCTMYGLLQISRRILLGRINEMHSLSVACRIIRLWSGSRVNIYHFIYYFISPTSAREISSR